MDYKINLSRIAIGDKFSDERALARELGYSETTQQKTRVSQYEDMKRYLSYQSSNNPKKKREIIVTEIKETPDEKIDGRAKNGGHGKYIDLLKPLILQKGPFCCTYSDLAREFFKIPKLSPRESDQEYSDYIWMLHSYAKEKIKTALDALARSYTGFHYSDDELFVIDPHTCKEIGEFPWRPATPDEVKFIAEIEEREARELLDECNQKRKDRGEDPLLELSVFHKKLLRKRCTAQVEEALEIEAYARCVECSFKLPPAPDTVQDPDMLKDELHNMLGQHMLKQLGHATTKIDGEKMPRFKMSYQAQDLHNELFPNYPWRSADAEGYRNFLEKKKTAVQQRTADPLDTEFFDVDLFE